MYKYNSAIQVADIIIHYTLKNINQHDLSSPLVEASRLSRRLYISFFTVCNYSQTESFQAFKKVYPIDFTMDSR